MSRAALRLAKPDDATLLQTILLRGVCGITPVWGAVSVLNATLRAAAADPASPLDLADLPEDALYPLFVPNSHAVPPIRALRSSATAPPPLRTADGRTLAAPSGCAAIVLVSDLDTQVEGLERILAAGGIGHGLGLSTRKGKMPASEVSGRTWSLVSPASVLTEQRLALSANRLTPCAARHAGTVLHVPSGRRAVADGPAEPPPSLAIRIDEFFCYRLARRRFRRDGRRPEAGREKHFRQAAPERTA